MPFTMGYSNHRMLVICMTDDAAEKLGGVDTPLDITVLPGRRLLLAPTTEKRPTIHKNSIQGATAYKWRWHARKVELEGIPLFTADRADEVWSEELHGFILSMDWDLIRPPQNRQGRHRTYRQSGGMPTSPLPISPALDTRSAGVIQDQLEAAFELKDEATGRRVEGLVGADDDHITFKLKTNRNSEVHITVVEVDDNGVAVSLRTNRKSSALKVEETAAPQFLGVEPSEPQEV